MIKCGVIGLGKIGKVRIKAIEKNSNFLLTKIHDPKIQLDNKKELHVEIKAYKENANILTLKQSRQEYKTHALVRKQITLCWAAIMFLMCPAYRVRYAHHPQHLPAAVSHCVLNSSHFDTVMIIYQIKTGFFSS